jgi:hypothetical protein
MKRNRIAIIALLVTIAILLGEAVAISRDYQDSWVLEGLEVPFLLFVSVYALAFFSQKSVGWMVTVAVVGRCVFLLIPNLKYVWFYGGAIDQQRQYSLANQVLVGGHTATQGSINALIYGTTPLIHLLLAIFSIVPGIPLADSMKFIPVLLSPLYPLLTYVLVRNLKFLQKPALIKYALFVSSIPIGSFGYVVTGTTFGILLIFLILTILVLLLQRNDRRFWFVFIFFVSALAMAHSVSSLLITVFLLAVLLIQKVPYFRLKSYLPVPALLAAVSICTAWLLFSAKFTLEQFVRLLFFYAPSGSTPGSESIPSPFFSLINVDIFGAVRIVLITYGAEIFVLLLALGGLIVSLKKLRHVDNVSKFIVLIFGVMLLLAPVGFFMKLGGFRVLDSANILFPIFVGVLILNRANRRTWVRSVILLSIMFFAFSELYPCQPIVPSANTLQKDLPPTEPIVYVTFVNSIYQRQVIGFAKSYAQGLIACDAITLNQIQGLTDADFYNSHLAWYYPLDKNLVKEQYDFFIVHIPGISGVYTEPAAIRTKDIILETVYNSSITYTNGESFVLRR